MAFTNTGSTAILNGLIGKSSSGPLSSCYLALSSTTPNQDGTNFTEPSSTAGYARAVVGLSSQSATQVMSPPVNGTTQNKEIIFFPEAYNVPLVKTQMKKIIVTAKTLYSHPKNVSKIYAALHTDLAW